MIITTDSLKLAICRRKTWQAYDHDIMIAKMSKETFMRELISAYDRCVSTNDYSNCSTRGYTLGRYFAYNDIFNSVYRPIDSSSIYVNCPNLRSYIGTYYWEF